MKRILLATSVALSAGMIAYPASASSNQRPQSLLIVNSSKTPIQLKSVAIAGTACAKCAPAKIGPHSAWLVAIGNKTTAFEAVIGTASGATATLNVNGQGGESMTGLDDPAVATHMDSVDGYMGSFDNQNLGTYTTLFIADSK